MRLPTALLAGAAALTAAAPAAAEIVVRQAFIAGGELIVAGRTDFAGETIALDDKLTARTDRGGRFYLRGAYRPPTCIGTLRIRDETRPVVIANCGPVGPAGPAGPAGPVGRAGPQGPPGRAAP